MVIAQPDRYFLFMLSIIIPTYNEKDNLSELVKRIVRSLQQKGLEYEMVFVDDHSTDGTYEYLEELKEILPLQLIIKQGPRGKAQSLLQGFQHAQGDILAFIDADLQYPPEALPEMLEKLDKADVVVGNRNYAPGQALRGSLTKLYNLAIGRVVLGLDCDVQSGMKIFKREVLRSLELSPSKWGFDYEFLFKSKRLGWKISQVDIDFAERVNGESNVNVLRTGFELAGGALSLRAKYMLMTVFKFLDHPHQSERLGYNYSNESDFLFLPEIHSAKKHIYPETVTFVFLCALALSAVIYGVHELTGWSVLVVVSGIISLFYFGLMVFKLYTVYVSFQKKFLSVSDADVASLDEEELPVYTVLIPLYKESEVVTQIKRAMMSIDYPLDRLDFVITLEHYDKETIEAIDNAGFPVQFKKCILPDVQPKTKPKALNVAFPQTRGEFLVIYDAEIIPDHDQLKKAYITFRDNPDVDVLQTRLDHYNADHNMITKLFNAEFAFHFDMFLPGLMRMNAPIPLSGHSTHFRRKALEDIGAWDPYNVTEDCDVGIRMARLGKRVEILDSMSYEEATTTVKTWVGQRARWIKGFIQTAIVHMRHPFRFMREIGGAKQFGIFLLTVPASVAVNLLNLVYWILLAGWIFTESEFIKALFPGPIFYVSLITFVAGNFIFIYLNLIGAYLRGRYALVPYSLLSPLYWIMLSYATVKASVEFIIKPHHWDKTKHGAHLKKKVEEPVVVKRYAIPTNT